MARSPARAIIYVRQSISREESISLELQESECRKYAEGRGYEVVDVVKDPGVSGLQFARRPGIRRAIEDVEAGRASVVVIYRWSRLSRRQAHQAVILDKIEKAGGKVESATEPVDTTKASGRFGRNVLLAAAEFESEQKSEQWKEAQTRRLGRGLPAGGAAPFGYQKPAKRGDPFEVDPVRGPMLAEMYARYLRGHGYQSIAKWMNENGHTSTRGNPMSVITVQRILDSGFGAGYLRVDVNVRDRDGKRIKKPVRYEKGAHQPVIDEDTWRAFQRAREKRAMKSGPRRSGTAASGWHLGAGLTVCGKCGSGVIVNTFGEKSQAICSNYRVGKGCTGVWINRATVENIVGLWLGGRLAELADRQDELLGVDDERQRLARELDAAESDEASIVQGRKNVTAMAARGLIPETELQEALEAASAASKAVADRIDQLTRERDLLAPDADVWQRLERGDDMPSEEWNALLKRVIRQVAVDKQTVTIHPVTGPAAAYQRSDFVLPRDMTGAERDASGRFAK